MFVSTGSWQWNPVEDIGVFIKRMSQYLVHSWRWIVKKPDIELSESYTPQLRIFGEWQLILSQMMKNSELKEKEWGFEEKWCCTDRKSDLKPSMLQKLL